MLLIITSTGDRLFKFINIDDLDDLAPSQKGFLVNFLHNFALRHAFQEGIAPKWLEIDQDNLRMKFSAWNVDFSSPSPDPLDSSRPAYVGLALMRSFLRMSTSITLNDLEH